MREDTRKRLDRLQRQDIYAWRPALVVLVLLFGGFFAFRTTVREERAVSGTVQYAAWRLNEDTGQQYPDIQVVLDNAALVRAGSLAPALPAVGARVTLRQRAMLLGYTIYEWDGPGPSPVPAPTPTPVSLP